MSQYELEISQVIVCIPAGVRVFLCWGDKS